MPSGQLISCLIEPQSSSQGCYMALWRCSSKHRTIILCSTHIDCLCLKGSSAKPISQQSKKAALLLGGSNESREIDMSAPLSLSQKRDFTSLHVLLISSYSHFISDFTADHFIQQNISSKNFQYLCFSFATSNKLILNLQIYSILTRCALLMKRMEWKKCTTVLRR